MRKLISLLSITFALLVSVNKDFNAAPSQGIKEYDVTYYSDVYGPMEQNSSLTVNGGLTINSGLPRSNLVIRYELYSPIKSGGTRAYSTGYISSYFSYPSVSEFTYSFDIDDRSTNYIRAGYITVRVGIYDVTNRVMLDYIESSIYLKKEEIIDIDNISGDLSYDKFLHLSEDKVTETFNFSNYTNLLDLEYYLYLDISSLSFSYTSFKEFKYKELYLSFIDEHNLFPYIKEDNGEKRLDLVPKIYNNNISFTYNDLFVDKETHIVSSTYKEGFIKTNRFYLPKNQINHLQGLCFYINAKEIGVSCLSYKYMMNVLFNSLLLGPCNVSEYCVVGGVVK